MRYVAVAAGQLARVPRRVDECGRDRDDYQQILALAALRGSQREGAGADWIFRCVANQQVDCWRRLAVQRARSAAILREPAAVASPEGQVVARELLQLLRGQLTQAEWGIFCGLAEGASLRELHRCGVARRPAEKFGAYHYRVVRLRERLLKFLDSLEQKCLDRAKQKGGG